MRDRNSRLVTVEDREAQMGDTAEIDFEGFVDGVAFEGGKGENYPLELGSGSFIPGFEEQMIGMKKGETSVKFTNSSQRNFLSLTTNLLRMYLNLILLMNLRQISKSR